VSVGDTKDRILDAAERLFAEHGFAATSLRTITAEAGVNLAAVNYHFGSKGALMLAIFERRLGPINERRIEMLDDLERAAAGAALNVEDVLRAFLAPVFETFERSKKTGTTFMRLVGQMHTEANSDLRQGFLDLFKEIVPRFGAALSGAVPHLTLNEIHRRMHFVIGAMAHALSWEADAKLHMAFEDEGDDAATVLEALVEFGAAGLRAPSMTRAREEAS
jgi:AcrR family transcriptional regulator